MNPLRALACRLVIVLLLPAATASAEYPDWQSLADVKLIDVVTRDPDGDLRETRVWFVLVEGVAYLRTNRSRWLDNLRRDPDLVLRIDGRDYEARAEEVSGDAIVEKVDRASAEKYGWQERMIHPFRMARPDILRILPRDAPP
jgi:hypothetical protein